MLRKKKKIYSKNSKDEVEVVLELNNDTFIYKLLNQAIDLPGAALAEKTKPSFKKKNKVINNNSNIN